MTAWIFPGQGSQTPGMGRAMAQNLPAFADARDRLAQATGMPLVDWFEKTPSAALTQTDVAQPAICALSLCLLAVFADENVPPPSAVAGHSLGHITALVAAGALGAEDGLRLVGERGALFAQAGRRVPGAMAAVAGLTFDDIAHRLGESGLEVWAVNENHPDQVAISGRADQMAQAMDLLADAGALCKRLNVNGAFHCPLLGPEADAFADLIDGLALSDPHCPILNNEAARALTTADAIRADLKRHMLAPVRWRRIVGCFVEMGVTEAIEIGPGRSLRGLCMHTTRDMRVVDTSTPQTLRKVLSWASTQSKEELV